MKLMYTRPEDNGVSIVIAAPKEAIERILGPLTQEQYEQHIIETSIPVNALKVKVITDSDLPPNREFRDAWEDITDDNKVNINLQKAKNIALERMRKQRNDALDLLDKTAIQALENGVGIEAIKIRKQALRDATEPLKALEVSGVNDPELINQIKLLSVLPK